MNFTSSKIKDFLAWSRVALKNDDLLIDREKKVEEYSLIEIEAIGISSSICSRKEAKAIAGKIDHSKMKSIMGDQFYNYDVMKAVGCDVYSTFYGITESTGNISKLAHLKSSVLNLHKFGSESVSGNALIGDLDNAKNYYVLKTPRTEIASADLTHELFAGLFAMNKMRKAVPNFAMVYGGFKCSSPVIDKDNNVTSFCASKYGADSVPYVIYETIDNSMSLSKYCKNCSQDEFVSAYLQVLFSTWIASDLVGYTHYDSHNENWLARKINIKGITDVKGYNGKFCIPYANYVTGEVYYVTSSIVATAIDYGLANVKYKGKNIGPPVVDVDAYGIADGSWPLHDAYKLLMFSAYDALADNNMKLVPVMQKIFSFFNKSEDILTAAERQRKYFFILPKVSETRKYKITDLIDHIAKNYNVRNILSKIPHYPILECSKCMTFMGSIKGSYIGIPKPKNFFEFYDVASHLAESSRKDYDDLVNNFNYLTASAEFKERINKSLRALDKYLNEVEEYNVYQLPEDIEKNDLLSKDMYQKLYNTHNSLVSVISIYEDLDLWLKIGQSVAILYSDKQILRFIKDTRDNISNNDKKILLVISEMSRNYRKYIRPLIKSNVWQAYVDRYPWYNSAGEILLFEKRFQRDMRDLFVEDRLPSALIKLSSLEPTEEKGLLPANRRVVLEKDKNGKHRNVIIN
jgi:hypothetical protein